MQSLYETEENLNVNLEASTEIKEITTEEIEGAITKLQKRKSLGPNEIYNELLKYGGDSLHTGPWAFFNKVIKEGGAPNEY